MIPFAFNAAASSAASALIPQKSVCHQSVVLSSFLTPFFLEETYHISVIVNVDIQRSRFLRQTGHCHNIAQQNNDKACACGNANLLYSYLEPFRTTQNLGIIGKRILCLCNTYGEIIKAQLVNLCQCFLCRRREVYCTCAIDFLAYLIYLFYDIQFILIQEMEFAFLCFQCFQNLFSQSLATLAAVSPNLRYGKGCAMDSQRSFT